MARTKQSAARERACKKAQEAVADAGADSDTEQTPDEAMLDRVPSLLEALKSSDASKRASALKTLATVFRDKDSIDKYSNTLDDLCVSGITGLMHTLWCTNAQEDDASLPSALLLLARAWEYLGKWACEDSTFHDGMVERLLVLVASPHEAVRVSAALAIRHGFSFQALTAHGGSATLRRLVAATHSANADVSAQMYSSLAHLLTCDEIEVDGEDVSTLPFWLAAGVVPELLSACDSSKHLPDVLCAALDGIAAVLKISTCLVTRRGLCTPAEGCRSCWVS